LRKQGIFVFGETVTIHRGYTHEAMRARPPVPIDSAPYIAAEKVITKDLSQAAKKAGTIE
jgi:hypothetical protein